jgi:hypothetical protein
MILILNAWCELPTHARHRMNPTPKTQENPLKRVANGIFNPLQRVSGYFRRRFQSAV